MDAAEFLIIGNGAAAVSAAMEIGRHCGAGGEAQIVQVEQEPKGYYYRAALTNFLLGKLADHELWGLPEQAQLRVARITAAAKKLDARRKIVTLDSGREIRFGKLLLASGARANQPKWFDTKRAGFHCLRTYDDAQRIIAYLASQQVRDVVIQGGGILGIEVAEALHERLNSRGVRVHLVHRQPFVLDRVVDAYAAELIQLAMMRDGVEIHCDSEISSVTNDRPSYEVRLANGKLLRAQMLLACVGNEANTGWLKDSGVALTQRGAIEVDRSMRVIGNDEIFAAGDVATVDERDQPVQNPAGLWQPARYQGRIAGTNMTRGAGTALEQYRPGMMLNSTRAWGFSLDSAGLHPSKVSASPDNRIVWKSASGEPVYKCAVLQNGRLAGFLLLGDRREARALSTLLNLRLRRSSEDVAFDGPVIPENVRERFFEPGFDLSAWVHAQAAAAPGNWASRDRLVTATPTASVHSAARGSGTPFTLGVTVLGATETRDAGRPLFLEIDGKPTPFIQGPVWVGNHPNAKVGDDQDLPRDTAMRLDPSGFAWFATSTNTCDAVRINGAPVIRPTVLDAYDTLSVGSWRAIVLPEDPGRKAKPEAQERIVAGWLRNAIQRVRLASEGWSRIGGLAQENDIVLEQTGVEPFVAQVHGQEGKYTLHRVGVSALVKIDGSEVLRPVALRSGQRVSFDGSEWRFETTEEVAAGHARRPAMGFLCAQNGPDAGRALALAPRDGAIRIGRGRDCELQLADPQLSRTHARIEIAGDTLLLRDLGSVNGTTVNGQRVAGDDAVELRDGAMVKIGAHTYRFSRKLPAGLRQQAATIAGTELGVGRTTVSTSRSGRGTSPGPARPRGIRLKPIANAVFPEGKLPPAEMLREGTLEIGRLSSKTLAGPDKLFLPSGADRISRRHADILVTMGGSFIRDLGSREGTRVNRNRISSEPIRLKDGDVISLAQIAEFEVEIPDLESGPLPTRGLANLSSPAFWLTERSQLEDDLPAIVNEELDACIGCHECMRACPLPDAQNVSIAALNAAAASGSIFTTIAQRFIRDCTQCRACVPVCPVGIERSRIVLWNKLKLAPDENLDPPLQLSGGKGSHTLGMSVGAVASLLQSNALLAKLALRDRTEILSRCHFRRLSDGEHLIDAGTYVSTLWIVLEGEICWALPTSTGLSESIFCAQSSILAAREFLADEPCQYVAMARREAIVVGIPRAIAKQFADRNDHFREALKKLGRDVDLARLPALISLTEKERADGLLVTFEPGQAVATPSRHLMGAVVVRGYVAESESTESNAAIVDYHRAGSVLSVTLKGEAPRLRAKTAAEIFLIPHAAVTRLRGGDSNSGAHSSGRHQAGEPMPEGRKIMAIDMRLCVDCNNCVDACGRRHGHPRIDRYTQGRQRGVFHVPNACYHCEDPKCLLCDVDGIVRTETGEIRIVEENCIGCGACAERCPYDNIQIIERRPKVRVGMGSLLQLIGLARTVERDAAPIGSELLASKCDLCTGYADGPACVRACPTGAAQRLSLVELGSLGELRG